jgi:quercetin dioxygenase-like cupin family protein
MDKVSLTALARQHLAAAHDARSGRSAHTVYGGHQHTLRQTLIALTAGTSLDDHESPGEATLQVLHGRVRLTSPATSWDGRTGDHLVIPVTRHGLHAVDDCVVLLTVAKSVQRYGERTYDDDPGDHTDPTDL